MWQSWKLYVIAAIVLVISFWSTLSLPVSESVRSFVSLPGVLAILAALWQASRDQLAHERAKELQERQHVFILGAASHMAEVAFNKHVQFAEQYLSRMDRGILDLFREGPPGPSATILSDLTEIRHSHGIWMTSEIEEKLKPFEQALAKMSSLGIRLQATKPGAERGPYVDEMFNVFSDILKLNREGEVNEEIAHSTIVSHLRRLLGVEELSRMRAAITQTATDMLEQRLLSPCRQESFPDGMNLERE
jgi:hypothetical protein